MTVVEKQTLSKTGAIETNEDAFWIGERFLLVADGVTSKSGRLFGGKSGGRVAVECIISTLETLRGDEDAVTVFTKIRDGIRAYIQRHEIADPVDIQASALIYSLGRRELWSVGDCQYLINGVYYKQEKACDTLLSQLRKMTVEALLLEGYTEESLREKDLSREMILPFLKLQARFINRKGSAFSYPVVNGELDTDSIVIHPVPAGSELIMASDGYPELKNTLAESEAALRQVLAEDPLCCRRYPSTKGMPKGGIGYDDRTYLKIIT